MILVLICSAGCSNKVMYDNLRLNQRQKCVEEPRPTYVECVKRTNKSYEDYERERKELLETPDEKNLNYNLSK
jgi:hypothetical protein